jgi:galactokinase
MALPFDTVVALSYREPTRGHVIMESAGFGLFELDPTIDPWARSVPPWAKHAFGVIDLLQEKGIASAGWRAVVDTDIPTGASLSSSAAFEVALINALLRRAGVAWSPIHVALLGQRVEHEAVGVPSGIMDQLISAGAIVGHASLMDCRALTLTPIPMPPGTVIAVMDSGTRRVLADVAYADRRAACERAASDIGVTALRDATIDQLSEVVDDTDRRRALHVITENARTLDAADAMRRGDVEQFGQLMTESHHSLCDDFAVSGPGLDAIVDIALTVPGCLGARMTGGGFAGCAVALVRKENAEAFTRSIVEGYEFGHHRATVWICEPSAGATIVDPLRSAGAVRPAPRARPG